MAKYSKKAGEEVEKAMRKRKKGTLKSGKSNKKVKSKKERCESTSEEIAYINKDIEEKIINKSFITPAQSKCP